MHQQRMSKQIELVQVNTALMADALLEIHPIPISCAQTREVQITSQSYSQNGFQFNYQFPGEVIVDRQILLRVNNICCTVTASANAATVTKASLRYLGVSAFPLTRSTKNLTVQLNNSANTCSPSDLITCVNSYRSDEELMDAASMTASFPDNRCNLTTLHTIAAQTASVDGYNPFNLYSKTSRGSFKPISIVTLQAATAILPEVLGITYQFTEPLMSPYLQSNFGERKGLSRLQNLAVTGNWLTSFPNACWMEYTAGVVDTAGACTLAFGTGGFSGIGLANTYNLSDCQLLCRTYVPASALPKVVSHKYWDIDVRSFPITPAALSNSGSPTTNVQVINTGSMRFGQIPHHILLFAKPTADVTSTSQPDCLLGINSIIVTTTRDSGALSGASQQQIYDMCCKNGLQMTFSEFNSYCGSPALLDLSVGDIAGFIPGTLENLDISFQVGLYNTTWDTTDRSFIPGNPVITNFTLFVVAFQDKEIILDGTQAISSGGVSTDEIRFAMSKPLSNIAIGKRDQRGIVSGGAWHDSLVSFLKKASRPILGAAVSGLSAYGQPGAAQALNSVGDSLLTSVGAGMHHHRKR